MPDRILVINSLRKCNAFDSLDKRRASHDRINFPPSFFVLGAPDGGRDAFPILWSHVRKLRRSAQEPHPRLAARGRVRAPPPAPEARRPGVQASPVRAP